MADIAGEYGAWILHSYGKTYFLAGSKLKKKKQRLLK